MAPGIKSGQSASYNYPTLVSRDEGGIKTRSVTTTEKLETFASQLERAFYQRNRKQRFRRGGKDRRRRRIIRNIHPARIRFGEVTDIFGKVSLWPVARTTSPTLRIILQVLLNTLGPGRERGL